MKIEMLDLKGQYINIKEEINLEIANVLNETQFIGGRQVSEFTTALSEYLSSKFVVTCGNGTDALQIALMALGLKRGEEVIIPAFTYAATAEVVALLGLTPVLVDVHPDSFNIDASQIPLVVSEKTKAIMPVHLFGQSADMDKVMQMAKSFGLSVIEDNAQAIGSKYITESGVRINCGTIGDIGCTSFFPSKNLGCYGDGGAMFTQNQEIAEKIKMIANHGQKIKYRHDLIGCNSRLDTIQAAILKVKLSKLNEYSLARNMAAQIYRELLKGVEEIMLPAEMPYSTHVYHQFTIRCKRRDELKEYLLKNGIPTMVYYPFPIHHQPAFADIVAIRCDLAVAERLSEEVLSLPMHTELKPEEIKYIADSIKNFFCK